MNTMKTLCSTGRLAGMLLFVAAFFAGCASDKDKAWSDLKEFVDEKKDLIEESGDGLTVTSVSLDNFQLTIMLEVSDGVTPDEFRQRRQEGKITMLKVMTEEQEPRKLLELCVKADVQIKMVFHFLRFYQDVLLVVPVNEIEEALQGKFSVIDDDINGRERRKPGYRDNEVLEDSTIDYEYYESDSVFA